MSNIYLEAELDETNIGKGPGEEKPERWTLERVRRAKARGEPIPPDVEAVVRRIEAAVPAADEDARRRLEAALRDVRARQAAVGRTMAAAQRDFDRWLRSGDPAADWVVVMLPDRVSERERTRAVRRIVEHVGGDGARILLALEAIDPDLQDLRGGGWPAVERRIGRLVKALRTGGARTPARGRPRDDEREGSDGPDPLRVLVAGEERLALRTALARTVRHERAIVRSPKVRRAIAALWREGERLTDGEIATRCGMSQVHIRQIRHRLKRALQARKILR